MIRGDRVSLDTINYDDHQSLRNNRNLPEIWDWCRQHTLISGSDQTSWADMIEKNPTVKMFSIRENFEFASPIGMHDKSFGMGKLVGVCGLTDINLIHRRAEFSLYIFPEYHRRGYAHEALRLLFKHGFDDWNLHSIWGETFDGNPALTLFTDKMGMVYEGTRRQFYFKNGKYVDAHIISITKEEFYERANGQ